MNGKAESPTAIAGESRDLPRTIREDLPDSQVARTISREDEASPGFQRGIADDAKTKLIDGPPPSFAWLAIMNGPWAGRIFSLNPDGTTLGRDARSEIILDDDAVSTFHATLREEEDEEGNPRYFIQDLATSNGTFVNGEEVIKQFLNDKDTIQIGETKLVFLKV
jgi:hypothetical protein